MQKSNEQYYTFEYRKGFEEKMRALTTGKKPVKITHLNRLKNKINSTKIAHDY
jgi:hypothetical protein